MGGQRGLAAVIVGIALLLVATVAVVLLAGDRPVRSYPAGSPEAALQAYLVAWEASDAAGSYGAFSRAVRSETSLDDYRRQVAEYGGWATNEGPSRRVFIDQATVTGDRATLELTIEETWVSGLNVNRNRSGRVVTMVREDGAWRFDRLFIGMEMYWPGK